MWSARSRRRGRTTLTPTRSGAESQTGTFDQPPWSGNANTAVAVTKAQQVGGQAGEPAAGHLFALVAHGALRPQPRRVQSLSRPRPGGGSCR